MRAQYHSGIDRPRSRWIDPSESRRVSFRQWSGAAGAINPPSPNRCLITKSLTEWDAVRSDPSSDGRLAGLPD